MEEISRAEFREVLNVQLLKFFPDRVRLCDIWRNAWVIFTRCAHKRFGSLDLQGHNLLKSSLPAC